MKINFRHGVISGMRSGGLPTYLIQSGTSQYVQLNVSPDPFVVTMAHGSSDYLFKFDRSYPTAWGPMTIGLDHYLYIELNLLTGQPTFGFTNREPKTMSIEPSNPIAGDMWFDLSTTRMKVRNNDNTVWLDKPRIVVGKVISGSMGQIVQSGFMVSTVGLDGYEAEPGYVMLDPQLRPIRGSTGELITSGSIVHVVDTVGTSGILSSPVNDFIPVRADEPIPAMSLVYISSSNAVRLASGTDTSKAPIGLVQQAIPLNDFGVITQSGEITYDQWNWADQYIGKPVYCGPYGEIVTGTVSSMPSSIIVGYIKNSNTIILMFDSSSAGSDQVIVTSGTEPPLHVTATSGTGVKNFVVTIDKASATQDGYMSKEQAQILIDLEACCSTVQDVLNNLDGRFAAIGHTHSMSDIDGLEECCAAVQADIDYIKNNYSLIGHRHDWSEIDNAPTFGDMVLTTPVTVIGTNVGAADAGTVFPAGMTFQQFVERISVKALHPSYIAPTTALTLSVPAGSYEIGTTISVSVGMNFSQNSAGPATALRLVQDGNVVSTSVPYSSTFTVGTTPTWFKVSTDYSDGPVMMNNLGVPDPVGQILAGTVDSAIAQYIGVRLAFYGTTSIPVLTSNAVRALANTSQNTANNTTVNSSGTPTGSTTTPNFTITIPVGAAHVVFAYPATSRQVASVKYQELSDSEVKANFVETSITVTGANGAPGIPYRVYTYTPVQPFTIENHYKVFI